MSQLTIALIFGLTFIVALLRGAGWAYVLVYLPAMILFNQLPQIPVAHAPLAAQFAPMYAIILALPFRREPLKFKWSWLDTVVVLLLISATITAWTTEIFETGVNIFRTEIVTWVGPYFLARIVFKDIEIRRAGLYMLVGLIAIISVAALIEFRIQPYWYLHVLKGLQMGNKINPMAYYRYGFNRVAGPVEHPIYFGNMCVVLLGMVAVLARTSGTKLSNPWVALALFGAFGCLITSISFTPYVGFFAGTVFALTLLFIPFSRKMVLPLTFMVFAVLFTFTYTVAHQKLGEKPDGELPGSLWTRKKIISESWHKAVEAGPFGWGKALDFSQDEDSEVFDLKSVDNTYMLFTMTRGWVYTTLWISIAFVFSMRMTIAFNHVKHKSQVFPLAVGTATILALMVSMYTVWAGALYVVVWSIMLGLVNTLMDMVIYPETMKVVARPHGIRFMGARRQRMQPRQPGPMPVIPVTVPQMPRGPRMSINRG
jgi:hypothetical protein